MSEHDRHDQLSAHTASALTRRGRRDELSAAANGTGIDAPVGQPAVPEADLRVWPCLTERERAERWPLG